MPRPASNPLDFTRNILPEELFLGMLCLERKRAERSGDKFTLILLDARPALSNASAHDVLRRVTKAADKARRDTDIAGWYKDHAVLGIIFTELRDTEESGTNETLRNKIQRSLAAELTAEELELVHVSLHTFADDSDEQDTNHDQSNPAFHPDLFHRNQSKRLPLLVKRIMDIAGSVAALLAFSPVFAAIAIAIKPELTMQIESTNSTPELGYPITKQLLERGHHFTALFAYNDISAIGACWALREAGIRVPEDVSVMGFDDIPAAGFNSPRLTTVRQPLERIGQIAAKTLVDRIEGIAEYVAEIAIEPELVVRASTSRAASAHAFSAAAVHST
jgi:hypothetical protein